MSFRVPIWLRALSFLVIAPGSILGLFPWWITDWAGRNGPSVRPLGWVAVALFLIGVSVLIWCFGDFVRRGLGTPAPYDPPKKLVVDGLYRFTRNPMYVGLVVALVGESTWFQSFGLSIYTIGIAIAFHLRVLVYEEPKLTELFGEEFAAYRRRVPRWIPRMTSAAVPR